MRFSAALAAGFVPDALLPARLSLSGFDIETAVFESCWASAEQPDLAKDFCCRADVDGSSRGMSTAWFFQLDWSHG